MPPEFTAFLAEVKKLEFEQRPRYRKLIGSFRHVLTRLGATMEELNYDWTEEHEPKHPPASAQSPENPAANQ